MNNFPIDQLSERLDAAITALNDALPHLETSLAPQPNQPPAHYVEIVTARLLFPVVRDLAICIKTVSEDIEIEAAGYNPEMRRLVESIRDLILADILPIKWTAVLLTCIHRPLLDLGLIKSAQDFADLFHRQLAKVGEEGKRLGVGVET